MKYMKKAIILTCIFLLIFLSACGKTVTTQDISNNTAAEEPAQDTYYTANDYYHMESEGSLHILSHFETCQQESSYSCGPAAALMVLNHYGMDGYSEAEICEQMGTNPLTGTSFDALRGFLENAGFRLDYHADTELRFADLNAWEDYLIRAIDENAPVIVEWVDWYGHWQIVIGIDTCGTENMVDDVLIMADPYDITDHCQDGYYIVPFARFFCMWRESPFAETEVPYEQPFITVYAAEIN